MSNIKYYMLNSDPRTGPGDPGPGPVGTPTRAVWNPDPDRVGPVPGSGPGRTHASGIRIIFMYTYVDIYIHVYT